MKTVVFTQRVEFIESYGERRDCADQRIAQFIRASGYLPVPLPNCAVLAEEYLCTFAPAGIILTGGNSLQQYGGNAPERDAMDSILLELAVQREIPLYGFCRGMQSILTYFGNKLENVEGHVAVRHFILGETGNYEVNSYHNQACKKMKEDCGLIVTSKTADGVIESVRHKNFPIIGNMWHPEREECFDKNDIQRIKLLFG